MSTKEGWEEDTVVCCQTASVPRDAVLGTPNREKNVFRVLLSTLDSSEMFLALLYQK